MRKKIFECTLLFYENIFLVNYTTKKKLVFSYELWIFFFLKDGGLDFLSFFIFCHNSCWFSLSFIFSFCASITWPRLVFIVVIVFCGFKLSHMSSWISLYVKSHQTYAWLQLTSKVLDFLFQLVEKTSMFYQIQATVITLSCRCTGTMHSSFLEIFVQSFSFDHIFSYDSVIHRICFARKYIKIMLLKKFIFNISTLIFWTCHANCVEKKSILVGHGIVL